MVSPRKPRRHPALCQWLRPALFVACLACLVEPSAAEGMTSHPWLAYLGYKYTNHITSTGPELAGKIKKALDDNQNTLSMASSFPDYFYLPGWMLGVPDKHDVIQPYRDSSEAAHWPPFQGKLATYIRTRPDFNKTEWSKETSRAVAQLFGMGAHFITDVHWESLQYSHPGGAKNVNYWNMLQRGRGFTSFMSSQNWGDAGYGNHNEMPSNLASDTGLPAVELSNPARQPFASAMLGNIGNKDYPNKMMAKLLVQDGHHVTTKTITRVSIEYDIIFTLMNTFGGILNGAIDEFMNEQPKAVEELFEYPVGGLMDIGYWVWGTWQRYAVWLDKGPPPEIQKFSGPKLLQSEASSDDEAEGRATVSADDVVPEDSMVESEDFNGFKNEEPNYPAVPDPYQGWSKKCFDKLQPYEKALKNVGAISAKFEKLMKLAKGWKKHTWEIIRDIGITLGKDAKFFFEIVEILFECVQPTDMVNAVTVCSGGQKLDALATPFSGNHGKGKNCWSQCHSTADMKQWKLAVTQDCERSGLQRADLGHTISHTISSIASHFELEEVDATDSANTELVEIEESWSGIEKSWKWAEKKKRQAERAFKQKAQAAERWTKKAQRDVRRKVERSQKWAERKAERAAKWAKRKAEKAKKWAQRKAEKAEKWTEKKAKWAQRKAEKAEKWTEKKAKWAKRKTEELWNKGKNTLGKFRYKAKCKDPSKMAAKCAVRTGVDTFVSMMKLTADRLFNEPAHAKHVSEGLVTSTFPIGNLGRSLATGDFNGDGHADLASGAWGANGDSGDAPQAGAVSLSYGKADGTLESPTTLRSSHQYKYGHDRFGWSVVALDFNGDGIDDLAVSSPAAQKWPDGLPVTPDPRQISYLYSGRVEVFLGAKGKGLQMKSSTVIETKDPNMNLGMLLKALDVNGDGKKDLCIGNPLSSYPVGPTRHERENKSQQECQHGVGDCDINKGSLMVFFSSAKAAESKVLDANEADIVINGPSQYDLFASDIAVVDGLLLVGAPGKRIPARKLDIKPKRVRGKDGPRWWMHQRQPSGSIKLPGADPNAGKPPGGGNPYDTTGGVYVYEINKALLQDTKKAVPKPFAILMGQDGLAEFGKQVVADHTGSGRVVITSPAAGMGFWSAGLRGGGAVVFNTKTLRAAASSPTFTLEGSPFLKQDDLAGYRINGATGTLRRGYLGETAYWTKKGSLILGAPFKNSNTIPDKGQVGAFYVFSNLPATGHAVDVPKAASHYFVGTRTRQRIGSSIVELRDGTFAVGMPMVDNHVTTGEAAIGMMVGGVGSFQCDA